MIDLIVNSTDACQYLIEKRTSQAIGSYITEAYFQRLFLNHLPNTDVAKDWFSAYDFDNNLKFYFIIRSDISHFDEEIAEYIERKESSSVGI